MTLFTKKTKNKNNKETIDWSFIRKLEGYSLTGYVPDETNEKTNNVVSGITIVSGFDLGQRKSEDILKMKLPISLTNKLLPYVSIKGKEAKKKLIEIPLKLSSKEGDILERKVKEEAYNRVEKEYNKHSKIKFKDIPFEARTVIMSVGFQYGSLAKRTPNFFKTVTNQNWEKAYIELKHFGDSFPTRRKKEARYLKKLIDKKRV